MKIWDMIKSSKFKCSYFYVFATSVSKYMQKPCHSGKTTHISNCSENHNYFLCINPKEIGEKRIPSSLPFRFWCQACQSGGRRRGSGSCQWTCKSTSPQPVKFCLFNSKFQQDELRLTLGPSFLISCMIMQTTN